MNSLQYFCRALSLIFLFMIPAKEAVSIDAKNKLSIGVVSADGYSNFKKKKRYLDGNIEHVVVYQDIAGVNYRDIKKYFRELERVILVLKFSKLKKETLSSISGGYYDKQLIKLAKDIKLGEHHVVLRPLHEFNGDWYKWGVYFGENKKADFIKAWRHIVNVFKREGAPVSFQLNYNRTNAGGNNSLKEFKSLYPGDEYVDMVVISTFNRAFSSPYHRKWMTFEDEFAGVYSKIIQITDKPIGVAETSSTSYGGDKAQWIYEAFVSFKKFNKLVEITWFLKNIKPGRASNDVVLDWDINTSEEKEAYISGYNYIKNNIQ